MLFMPPRTPSSSPSSPRLLVGLGNPDPPYATTYHNVGFLFIDYALHACSSPDAWKHANGFSYLQTRDTTFVKPTVFMNESGKAVSAALRQLKVLPRDLYLVHDDTDIALGSYKLSFDKHAGGHRGVQSVLDALHTSAFYRIRIGVRASSLFLGIPLRRRVPAAALVLQKIRASHRRTLETVFADIITTLYAHRS